MGTRLSQWADPFQVVPAVTAHYWKEAQKLVGKGYFNLGFKLTIKGVEHFVFPSTERPDHCVPCYQWAKEFALLERLLNTLCPLTHRNTSLIRYIL